MKSDVLREKFLSFFKSKKHKIVESDSLVPGDDPTVLFTPAGMNQFKKYFLGLKKDFTRAATSQRCLRTDDLDKVGKTSGHHTFFEMLGNFSFGDYFKEDAITWAWEFLTDELKIDTQRLWVSVYKEDDEAYRIWQEKIGIEPGKILRLGDKENFWPSEAKEKGPNGPCGPCSEIFFDLGESSGCGKETCNPSCGCGRFLEVWNLVFTQFNRKDGGMLQPLPQKNIDTGMGLERLAAIMQGVANNFETDLFKPLTEEILSNCQTIKLSNQKEKELVYAIADHIRAIAFAIYDGVLPSNEGRGYVVRKLIRKGTLHLRSLGFKRPYLYKLVPVLADIMKNPYPGLLERRENISEIILREEKNFISILGSGNTLFLERFGGLSKGDSVGIAKQAYRLYDTYGIPLEITLEWLEKNGFAFSKQVYDSIMQEQKIRSQQQSVMKGDVFDMKDLHLKSKSTVFFGYVKKQITSRILKIIKDNEPVKKIVQGQEAKIILDRTVFYPESGGQIGDTGELIRAKNIFSVQDTKKTDRIILHIGKVQAGSFKTGDTLTARIDQERRLSIARNHTATHLLQAALRDVLGPHVRQQGSLVASDRLRFDFTHFKDINEDELYRIEEKVNNYILENHKLIKKQMSLSEAKKIGALAFFGEKYENKVRVISISGFSKELCAGTHLDSTGQIGLFKIVQEGSIASGIRRIEAVTGKTAYKLIREREASLFEIASVLGIPAEKAYEEGAKRISFLITRNKELQRQINAKTIEAIVASLDRFLAESEAIGTIHFVDKEFKDADMNVLRQTADLIRSRAKQTVAFLSACTPSSISIVVALTKDLVELGCDASQYVKEIALEIGGSGGGRKDFAQAGGNLPQNRQKAVEKLKGLISQIKL